MKPTSGQKYDFVNEHLAELQIGKKKTVVMEGRVYDVKYRGLEKDVFHKFGSEQGDGISTVSKAK